MDLNAELIAAEKRLAELKGLLEKSAQAPHEAACDVTACLCAYNDQDHVMRVLRRLWAQGVRMDVLVALDSETSDMTREILTAPRLEKYMVDHASQSIRALKYIGEIGHRPQMENTLAAAKAAFLNDVKTEFVWWMDADVYLDAGTIRTAIQFMRSRPDVGAACAPYVLKSDHLEQGAMLMRTDVARELGFDGRPDGKTRCVCMNIARDLAQKNLKVEAIPAMDAFHGKWGS
jgi:hypothetical protein